MPWTPISIARAKLRKAHIVQLKVFGGSVLISSMTFHAQHLSAPPAHDE
jgi:hypothetical protein